MNKRVDTDNRNVQTEVIEYIFLKCGKLAPTLYLIGHNAAAMIVYLEILKMSEIHHNRKTPYYRYNLNLIEED